MYLVAMRRHWKAIVASVVVATLAGLAVGLKNPPEPAPIRYEATALVVRQGTAYQPNSQNVYALTALATNGELPVRVAERLGFQGDPEQLLQAVSLTADNDAGVVRIVSTTDTADEAIKLVNGFGQALVDSITDDLKAKADQVQAELASLSKKIAELNRKARGNLSDADTRAALLSEKRQYSALVTVLEDLVAGQANGGGVRVLVAVSAKPISTGGGLLSPESLEQLLIIAAVLGLLGGIVLALTLDRFDDHIHTRNDAERHFGFPVVAEIPWRSRKGRKGKGLASLTDAWSGEADAYRLLAVLADAWRPGAGDQTARAPAAGGKVLLVTSAGPGAGKTTVTAELAVAIAGTGAKVLAIGCDFWKPKLQDFFNVSNETGLARVLATPPSGDLLDSLIKETAIPGVSIVPSGPPLKDPRPDLLAVRVHDALELARAKADIVLVDTAGLFTIGDTAGILDSVDGVILVCRSGQDQAFIAARVRDTLESLHAAVLGVVLTGVREYEVPKYYYGYYFQQPSHKETAGAGRRGRRSKGDAPSRDWG